MKGLCSKLQDARIRDENSLALRVAVSAEAEGEAWPRGAWWIIMGSRVESHVTEGNKTPPTGQMFWALPLLFSSLFAAARFSSVPSHISQFSLPSLLSSWHATTERESVVHRGNSAARNNRVKLHTFALNSSPNFWVWKSLAGVVWMERGCSWAGTRFLSNCWIHCE